MPLSTDGNKIRRKFKEEYGDKEGESYFYAKENKDKKFKDVVTKGVDPDQDPVIWWLMRMLSLPVIHE